MKALLKAVKIVLASLVVNADAATLPDKKMPAQYSQRLRDDMTFKHRKKDAKNKNSPTSPTTFVLRPSTRARKRWHKPSPLLSCPSSCAGAAYALGQSALVQAESQIVACRGRQSGQAFVQLQDK
jgi:hypothetical protein